MLASRLWRRGQSRRLSQNSAAKLLPRLSPEETYAVPFSREGLFAGRKLGVGFTELHEESTGYLLAKSLHRELVFAESGRTWQGCAHLCPAYKRRLFCSSNAWMSEANVSRENRETFALQQDHVRNRKIKSSQEDANMYSDAASGRSTLAQRSDPLVSQHKAGIADCINGSSIPHQNDRWTRATRNTTASMLHTRKAIRRKATPRLGKENAQQQYPHRFQGNDLFGSPGKDPSFGRLDNFDDVEDEENARLGLHMENKDNNVLTLQDRKTVQGICNLLDGNGWTASTKVTLEERHFMHLSQAVVARVILRQKNVALASSFFQWACECIGHDIRLYHAYLTRLGETKNFDEMWGLLPIMKDLGMEVNGSTFCIIIRACGAAGVPAMAVDAFKRASEYGIPVDIHLYRALLNTFFLSNLVEEARLCYSRMVEEHSTLDTATFYTLIRGFRLSLDIEDAQRSFDVMLKEGGKPDIMTYNALIAAYCDVYAMDKAMSTFSDLQKRGLKPTASTVNLLINAFCKRGSFDDAINLFASVKTTCLPDQSTFNILLHGLFSGKETSKAIKFFLIMEKEGLTNKWTFIHLSNGLRQSQQTEKVRHLLRSLFAKHGYNNTEVCVALLYNLSYSGELDEAESLFEGMLASSTEPNMQAYAIMISFYCRLEMLDKALQLFSEVKEGGCRPNVYCYTPIVGALLKVNRVADALKCFQEMMEYGYEVNAITCDFLLRELCKHAMLEDVVEVFNAILDNKFPIRSPTFIEFMKCLCKVGKIEEANTHFRAMYELGCLPLEKEAAVQALNVMDIMSRSQK